MTGHLVDQPIDEFNQPTKPYHDVPRVPPAQAEVDELFGEWRQWLPYVRKFLPAARDYLAASLWRRAGLRINESVMLDIRDWRPDLGPLGSCTSAMARAAAVVGRRPVWCRGSTRWTTC